MNGDEIPELEPELARLIARARGGRVVPPALRESLEARLAPTLTAATSASTPATNAGVSPAATRPLSALARNIGIFALGAAAGVGGHAMATRPPPAAPPEIRYVDRVIVATPDAAAPRAGNDEKSDAKTIPEASSAPSPVPVPPPPAVDRDADLARELALIDTAQSALARNDTPGALDALSKHANAFPNGRLAEQREALAIQTLVRAGRPSEANARASRFQKKYPRSLFLPVVRAALETIP